MSDQPTTKFTANLDAATDADFKRLTDRIGDQVGRVPAGEGRGLRYPARRDVLCALVTVALNDPHVEAAVIEQVRADADRHVSSGEQETR